MPQPEGRDETITNRIRNYILLQVLIQTKTDVLESQNEIF